MLFDPFVSYESVRFTAEDGARFRDVEHPPQLDHAVPKRRLEFAAGRHCAVRALRRLEPSWTEGAITIGEQGAPAWPAGIVGAITHGHGFAAAAVARTRDALGVGVDTERVMDPSTVQEIATDVATPRELDALRADLDAVTLLTVVFSAKESLYKCLYPLVRRFFDFHDVAIVHLSPAAHTFEAELQVALGGLAPRTRLTGRFEVAEGLVHTGVVLAAPRA